MDRAVEAHDRGDHTLAARGYREALRLSPSVRGAYQNLTLLAVAAGRPDDALKLARAEVERHPTLAAPRLNLATLLVRSGRVDEVAAVLAPIRVAVPVGDLVRAEGLRRAGDLVEARAHLEGVIGRASDVPNAVDRALLVSQARRALAWMAASGGDWDATADQLGRLGPLRTEADVRLQAMARVHQGDMEGASGLLAERADAASVAMAAWCAAARGELAAAAEALNRVNPSELSAPARRAVYRLRARLAVQAGEFRAALDALDAALSLGEADTAGLRLDRAVVLAHMDELQKAMTMVESVLKETAEHPRALSLRDLLAGG